MEFEVKEVSSYLPERKYKYSICTLVTNKEEYHTMVQTFIKSGFTKDITEFLFIDNSNNNQFDAYKGLNHLLAHASGKYIILCHQDIEVKFDKEADLNSKIKELDSIDPSWAIAGNAGGLHLKKTFEHVTYPDKEIFNGPFPYKVSSIDENFILLKGDIRISFSNNLSGFHLYATDLCVIANVLGYSCYVIDFNLLHKSSGNMSKDFFKGKELFIEKYGTAFSSRYIRTTCTSFYLGSGVFKSRLLSKGFFIFLAKLPLKIRKIIKGDFLFNP